MAGLKKNVNFFGSVAEKHRFLKEKGGKCLWIKI